MKEVKELMNKLKDRRKKRGVSAEEIRREVGIAYAHLSRIESGIVDIKLSTLFRYLNAIGYKLKIIKKETEDDK